MRQPAVREPGETSLASPPSGSAPQPPGPAPDGPDGPGDGQAGNRRRQAVVRRNAEASLLIRLYRRSVPRSVRGLVADRVSPEARNRIMRRWETGGAVRRGTEHVLAGAYRLRHGKLLASPDRLLIRVADLVKLAQVRDDITPLIARRENLDTVCSAMRAAGVPFFCVRGKSPFSATVGVADRDRGRALAALRGACWDTAAYVSAMSSNRTPQTSMPGFVPASWRKLGAAPAVRITRFFATPGTTLVLGHEYGCDVEFWTTGGDELVAPRRNWVTETVPAVEPVIEVPGTRFTRLASEDRPEPGTYPTRPAFDCTLVEDVTFPIDAVYTWVDGFDPAWRRRRDEALRAVGGHETLSAQSANEARFLSRDELRFSLRSLYLYAPWIRRIYLVTDDQTPAWLDTSDARIRVVSHRDIFSGRGTLPTFNSHAIESQLHHIDGLAEHFLYLNDDVFLGNATTPNTFFHANGLAKFFLSPALVSLGVPTSSEPPVMSAGKNNRRLIEQLSGRILTQKVKHAPHPLRRSVLAEIEERYTDPVAATAAHQFRHPADLSITSSLHHYYAYFTQRSVVGDIRYGYADLADRNTPRRLSRLLAARDLDAFCLNDTETDEQALAKQMELLGWFLAAYFPVPSPFERPDA